MIPPLGPHGRLPRGRHRGELGEVAAMFVSDPRYAHSTTRQGIWDDFVILLEALEPYAIMEEVWISGSFLTEKENPGDLDLTFLMNVEKYQGDVAAQVAHFLDAGRRLGTLDVYVIPWVSEGQATFSAVEEYRRARGYWDDWWQRDRDACGRAEAHHNALPKRGYVEVKLNDYL
ncbi:DUF6932 family protein [Enemella sp. A6]|uniref:DUF6932 family protein n=1 Tax=Enemella sp. A6 TaxID=3440152 RepID=UPI003EB75A70